LGTTEADHKLYIPNGSSGVGIVPLEGHVKTAELVLVVEECNDHLWILWVGDVESTEAKARGGWCIPQCGKIGIVTLNGYGAGSFQQWP
jgi:hypothetical protein